jgi:hypothetical protein
MNRTRIIEILESYRPGEGLEQDPEVRQALELAGQDPGLAEFRRQSEAFDKAFGERLQSLDIPADLMAGILGAARSRTTARHTPVPVSKSATLIKWFHPAAFAAAAAIIILLALSFTFWTRPDAPGQLPALTSDAPSPQAHQLLATAHGLRAQFRPSVRSNDSSQLIAHLRARGGAVPATLPDRFSWDRAMACGVVEINGARVSILCFSAGEGSGMLHLLTFQRSDFPGIELSASPQITSMDGTCCASWADGEQIHVLYADEGEEKLRQWLDI